MIVLILELCLICKNLENMQIVETEIEKKVGFLIYQKNFLKVIKSLYFIEFLILKFQKDGIFFYNFHWKDMTNTEFSHLLKIVSMIEFTYQQGGKV